MCFLEIFNGMFLTKIMKIGFDTHKVMSEDKVMGTFLRHLVVYFPPGRKNMDWKKCIWFQANVERTLDFN